MDEYRHFANNLGKSVEAFKQLAQRVKENAQRERQLKADSQRIARGLSHICILRIRQVKREASLKWGKSGRRQEGIAYGLWLSLLLAALRYGCLIKSFA